MKLIESIMTASPFYGRNVNNYSSDYTYYKQRGPQGFMLHSVGCAQPSALTFVKRWNTPTYTRACVHGFIDAETQVVYQTMPWMYRAPHCGGSANNTHVGVEMCEPKWLQYKGVSDRFTVSAEHLEDARLQVAKSYAAAVELCVMLARMFAWDVTKPGVILSHAEAGKMGLASGHSDPEHLWTQLGLPYTMDTFRADVAEALGKNTTKEEKPMANKTFTVALPIMRQGDKGPAVRAAMLLLKDQGYYSGIIWAKDAEFGPKMHKAVVALQKAHGLAQDGVIGHDSMTALLGGM